jgi:hypothetical protein
VKAPGVYWRALCATLKALGRTPRLHKPATARRTLVKMRSRRKALRKLGGRCVCCGLGLEFLPVLEFHHVNGNGELHRRVLRALDTGLVGWVLDCPDPGRGLFALEVRCVVCHRMLHEAGACPHRKEVRHKRAA